ncbi:MAG: ABC transporter permease [Hyphomicrobiaceae bacterium TMED74]|nr:polyamine ABC transporter permease [Filomicrobium sp.]RPG41846.1 MAG: ABC transporter permease [Hyphomicrobiaceae bacterium TMED74]
MKLPAYASFGDRVWHCFYLTLCGCVLAFLIIPVLIVIPLSFNAEPYFSFTTGMLTLQSDAFSLRWYEDILNNGTVGGTEWGSWAWFQDVWNNAQWVRAMKNSFFIGIIATLIATTLGTIAALGLTSPYMPARTLITSVLISPMIVPLVITAAGAFFFLAEIGLVKTYTGIIITHAIMGIPFVIITVTATLSGFDKNLIRASQSLGASWPTTFFRVIMPLILPGMISGALFAFITSFDEVVAVLFIADIEQRTIPRQMWSGIREQISPTILAVATILVAISVMLLSTLELLRRRSERLRVTSS